MTIGEIKRHAEEMGIAYMDALFLRLQYIRQLLLAEIEDHDYPDPITRAVCEALSLNRFIALAYEQAALLREIERLATGKETSGLVPEEMIERARQYPVDQLVEFQHGRALAWCHDDRNPSLYLARRINKAHCPVCSKYFNSIDVLVDRDGLTFTEAVRRLAA